MAMTFDQTMALADDVTPAPAHEALMLLRERCEELGRVSN